MWTSGTHAKTSENADVDSASLCAILSCQRLKAPKLGIEGSSFSPVLVTLQALFEQHESVRQPYEERKDRVGR